MAALWAELAPRVPPGAVRRRQLAPEEVAAEESGVLRLLRWSSEVVLPPALLAPLVDTAAEGVAVHLPLEQVLARTVRGSGVSGLCLPRAAWPTPRERNPLACCSPQRWLPHGFARGWAECLLRLLVWAGEPGLALGIRGRLAAGSLSA